MGEVIGAASQFKNRFNSPEEALEVALAEFREHGKYHDKYDKIMILGLDNKVNNYDVLWFGAGLTTAQALALVTYMQFIISRSLNGSGEVQ